MNVLQNNFSKRIGLIVVFLVIFFNISAQDELELNINAPIFSVGKYSQKNLDQGIEKVGFAKIGYGFDFKFLHQLKNSKFKIGFGINYFQNPYDIDELNFVHNPNYICPDIVLCSNDSIRFIWDNMSSISDWKNLDFNVYGAINILKIKKVEYNIVIGVGATILFSPKFEYIRNNITGTINSDNSISFNLSTEQNVRIKLTEKFFFNSSLYYRVSKVHSKFTENLISEYVYYDFWQHTLGTKVGLVYVLNKRVLNK